MELINISGVYIASFGCERGKTKKTKGLDEGALKKNFNYTSRFWKILPFDSKRCIPIPVYGWVEEI